MGKKGLSYKMHWHSYGEIILVGPGDTNIFKVNKNKYDLVELIKRSIEYWQTLLKARSME